jgi:hypothetical protein
MPMQPFSHVPRLVSPRFQAQRLTAEHPCTLLSSAVNASQTLRLSASSSSAVNLRRSGASLQQVFGRSRARRLAMIVLTLLRMATSVWTEAWAMQAETMRRYPHLRD